MLGAPIASRGYGSVQFGQGTQLVPCQLFILKVKHFGSQISHFSRLFPFIQRQPSFLRLWEDPPSCRYVESLYIMLLLRKSCQGA